MPKIVDKVQRRKDIALSCQDLIHDVGIRKLTISEVAKTAGIGKGTVYEYFENKDDIVFEIINIHIEKHNEGLIQSLKEVQTTREKLRLFFKVVLNDDEENTKHFNGYKEFLSIVLSEENTAMKEFNCSKNEFFSAELLKIFKQGVDTGELKPEALELVEGIMTYQKGLALRKMTQSNFDEKENFDKFMDTIFKLIEIKND